MKKMVVEHWLEFYMKRDPKGLECSFASLRTEPMLTDYQCVPVPVLLRTESYERNAILNSNVTSILRFALLD